MTHECNEMHLIDDLKHLKYRLESYIFSYARQTDALFDAFEYIERSDIL